MLGRGLSPRVSRDEETIDTKYIAQGYDEWCGEPGAFDQAFRDLQRKADPAKLARLASAFDLAADEIDLDSCALSSGQAFERFYSKAYVKFHRLVLNYAGFEMPEDMAQTEVERIFRAHYPGGRGEAYKVACREGLRRIVDLIKEHSKDEMLDRYFEFNVCQRMGVPESVQKHVVRLLKDWVKLTVWRI